MARIEILKQKEFVPGWNDNDKEENPITFVLNYLSTQDTHEVIELQEESYRLNMIKEFRKAVAKIRNLEIEIGGEIKAIQTADEFLLTPGFINLFYEVIKEIHNMKAIVDKKK